MLRHIENEFRKLGEENQANTIREVRSQLVTTHKIEDFPFPKRGYEKSIREEKERLKNLLKHAVEELKKNASPESVTNYWRAKFNYDSIGVDFGTVDLSFDVPDCDWTEEEIKRPMIDIEGNPVPNMMIFLPEVIKGDEGLRILNSMYPKMWPPYEDRYTRKWVRDTHEISGWIKVESAIDAPNLNTIQRELENFAKRQGYYGQREYVYMLASFASKDLNNHYFDENDGERTWSGVKTRLLGTIGDGYVRKNCFGEGGYLNIYASRPDDRDPRLGARFEEVKRT